MSALQRSACYLSLVITCVTMLNACNTASTPAATSDSTAGLARQQLKIAAPQPPLSEGQHLQAAQADTTFLLNRISWGVNASTAAQMQALGMDNYLMQQLQAKSAIVPNAVQAQIDALTISQKPFEQMMRELEEQRRTAAQMKGTDDTLRKAYQQELTRIAKEAATRSLLRHIYSSNQLLEQMDWFWMNHFNISNRKENLRAMLGDFDEHAIRPFALGNFRDLLRATMLHPAMLRYLDNEHNASHKINENYARELMELHTMGVGSGYTQNDVQELARVLTGVGINLKSEDKHIKRQFKNDTVRRGIWEFDASRHDFDDKNLLGVNIRGQGLAELDQVLTILTRQPATAKFISKKLATYFVSDTPTNALVDSMAQSFLKTDGDIPSVLKTMFDSQEFTASLGKKFKDPMHYVISAVRLAYDDKVIRNTTPILNWLNTLGEQPGGHLTPDGYALVESAWASPAQMTNRFDIAKIIARGAPNLFKLENEEAADNQQARELAKPILAQSPYVKSLAQRFGVNSQETLTQAPAGQDWNTYFLSTPEMMRR